MEQTQDFIIDKDFILKDDLRDFIFLEDSTGTRYRERIRDEIKKIGVENWFKLKGYPTSLDSVWKNRYVGSLTTLGEEVNENGMERGEDFVGIESQGYYLWENYLPENMWNDKELLEQFRVGTKEYIKRVEEEEKADKKYGRKSQKQASLFEEKPKKSITGKPHECFVDILEFRNKLLAEIPSDKAILLEAECYTVLNTNKLKTQGELHIGILQETKNISKAEFEKKVTNCYGVPCEWITKEQIKRVPSKCNNCREDCIVDVYDFDHYGEECMCDTCKSFVGTDKDFKGYLARKRTPTGKIPKKAILTEKPSNINKEKSSNESVILKKNDENFNKENAIKENLNETEDNFNSEVEQCIMEVTLLNADKLAGKRLDASTSHKMSKGKMGGSWGSGGKIGETNEELMETFIKFFKNNIDKPYADIEENVYTTSLKAENVHLNISKEAMAFLISQGFDFKNLDIEERKIKASQGLATPQDLAKARTFELMEQSMDKLRDECYAIKNYFESILDFMDRMGKKKSSIEKLTKLGYDLNDLNKLKEIYEQKAKTYKIYYCKVYEQRWGKPADEEYANV